MCICVESERLVHNVVKEDIGSRQNSTVGAMYEGMLLRTILSVANCA